MPSKSGSGQKSGGLPPKRTREQRFREIRDEIMAHSRRLRPIQRQGPAGLAMQCGPFRIEFSPPGAWGLNRGCNLVIWPAGRVQVGRMVLGDKVMNVDWDQYDNVDLISFRSGPWEAELLAMLRGEGGVRPFC